MTIFQYAPKDKQTEGLCSTPPQSVCDADYGLSVGRGSFHFLTGDWTRLRQTVSLNTPGKQDGGFSLIVSGHEVISRSDVFYRDVPIPTHTSPLSTVQPSPSPTQPSNGGLLDGLIGGLLGGLENVFSRVADPQVWGIYVMPNGLEEAYHIAPIFHAGSEPSYLGPRDLPLDVATSSDANGALALGEPIVSSPLLTKIIPPTTPTVTQLASLPEVVDLVQKPRPVGFSGLFFRCAYQNATRQWDMELMVTIVVRSLVDTTPSTPPQRINMYGSGTLRSRSMKNLDTRDCGMAMKDSVELVHPRFCLARESGSWTLPLACKG